MQYLMMLIRITFILLLRMNEIGRVPRCMHPLKSPGPGLAKYFNSSNDIDRGETSHNQNFS